MARFIKFKDQLYNISCLKSAYHKNKTTYFLIKNQRFSYPDKTGYIWAAFTSYTRDLFRNDLVFKTCFDLEEMIEEEKDLMKQMCE